MPWYTYRMETLVEAPEVCEHEQCDRSPVPGRTHCILHLDDATKDPSVFEKTFEHVLRSQGQVGGVLNLDGMVIITPFVLRNAFNRVSVVGTKFLAGASFEGAELWQGDFSGATFELAKENDYRNSSCVSFVGAHFHCKANFHGATFCGKANFRGVNFHEKADFKWTRFLPIMDKPDRDAKPITPEEFLGADFMPRDWKNPTLREKEEFLRSQCADFSRTKFFKHSHFNGAIFFFGARFYGAKFTKKARFLRTNFIRGADFREARLNALFNKTWCAWSDFRRASLEDTEFRSVRLESCQFSHANGLEKCRFVNVEWTGPGNAHHWVLGDELRVRRDEEYAKHYQFPTQGEEPRTVHPQESINHTDDELRDMKKREDIKSVETAYRELKVNYESHKNFPEAGNFYYGEMEMRRLSSTSIIERPLLWSYKLLSAYGESIGWATFWFALVLVGSGLAYSLGGFTIMAPDLAVLNVNQEPVPVQSMEQAVGFPKGWGHWWHTLSQSFALSFKTVFLRAGTAYKPLSPLTSRTMFLESIFGPLTGALFVLSVRRRLKRN